MSGCRSLAKNLGVSYHHTVTKVRIPKDVMEYFRKTGAIGGKTRAAKYSRKQLSEWGKLGGRPKGSTPVADEKKKQTKKGGK
jgi:hypothetical protein